MPCIDLRKETRRLADDAPARRVTLLMIDAESNDLDVLRVYPFGRSPPCRVIFEASNMPRDEFEQGARLLRRHGYRHVEGGHGAPLSVWHHVNSTEPWQQ